MAGCYGNSAEDRYFEGRLHRYLDEPDEEYDDYCPEEEEEYDGEDNSI